MKLKLLSTTLVLLWMTLHSTSAQEAKNTESKTVYKVILFKWKDHVTQHQKTEIKNIFNDLVGEVEGFTALTTRDIMSEQFETMYLLKFSSESAEKAYKAHDKHQILVAKAPELIADAMEYYYWE